MKILGIGVDVIKNSRIKNLIRNQFFLKRTFSANELRFSKKKNNKINYFAKRFAAKEAFVKAIGTGFRNNLNFKDIIVIRNKVGKPSFKINKKIKDIIKKQFKISSFNFFLSISDEKKYSIAYVVLQKK